MVAPVALAMKAISLTFTVGGTTTEFACHLAEAIIDSEPGEESRYDVLCPDVSYVTSAPETQTLSLRGIQSWEAAGLARHLWNGYGTNVAFKYAPFGNLTASATQPHWSGTFYVNARPQVGGEVGTIAELEREYPIVGSVSLLETGTITPTVLMADEASARLGPIEEGEAVAA